MASLWLVFIIQALETVFLTRVADFQRERPRGKTLNQTTLITKAAKCQRSLSMTMYGAKETFTFDF